jgi:hypothetical protein
MKHAHTPAKSASRPPARLVCFAGELVTAVVIIVGGGWLTALASLR